MTSRMRAWATNKRKSSGNITSNQLGPSLSPTPQSSTTPLSSQHTNNSSSTSISMNRDSTSGSRPPAYPYAPQGQGSLGGALGAPHSQNRSSSPIPPPLRTSMSNAQPYASNSGQVFGQPPAYAPPPLQSAVYGASGAYNQPPPAQQHPYHRGGGAAAEVEGTGRSKTALIVGIDFVSRP